MPLVSSPLAYPQSSSPPTIIENRKRPRTDEAPAPAKRRSFDFSGTSILGELSYPELNRRTVINELHERNPKSQITQKPKGPFIEEDEDATEDPVMLAMFQSVAKAIPTLPTLEPPVAKVRESDTHRIGFPRLMQVRTSSGRGFKIKEKTSQPLLSYEQLVSSQSTTTTGKATKSFYGVNIHDLIEKAANEDRPLQTPSYKVPDDNSRPSIESHNPAKGNKDGRTMMWTEKYRAKKFTDLVGDERTHRNVLRWLKGWDPIVFPGSYKAKLKNRSPDDAEETFIQRKILLLTGPPGMGKTTLAHVCARQAGYEVVEINASDERNRDVVKGRIKDSVGTENVKGVNIKSGGTTVRKAGRPVCVVVDEVDGVVGGSGVGGEGGFIKALIDLVALDQKNSAPLGLRAGNVATSQRAKKGERFRLLRPMILVCNDVYHPALRPLRSSASAEIIHMLRPPLDKVVERLKIVFEKEGVACDGDGVRRLCEATWGISNRRENRLISSNTAEGDIRGILVVGEWAATKMRASVDSSKAKTSRLTKKWVEDHMLEGLSHGGDSERRLGRGGIKDVVQRVFLVGAGFPRLDTVMTSTEPSRQDAGHSLGVSELSKGRAIERLRNVIDSSGETDRIVADCFATYPSHSFQDDTILSKPNAGYEWLHFHDCLSKRVFSGQEWELSPYLSQAVLGFHYLFASPPKNQWSGDQKNWDDDHEEERTPFSGLRADFEASEAQKQTKAIVLGLHSSLSGPLLRAFRSRHEISIELLPHLIKILLPDVKPVIVGGSGDQKGVVSIRKEVERSMVQRAVSVMSAVGVTFERARIEGGQSRVNDYIYRMQPPLDTLVVFDTASQGGLSAITQSRYAVRQLLDQEYQKHITRQSADLRQARYRAGGLPDQNMEPVDTNTDALVPGADEKASKPIAVKRDFFGRIIRNSASVRDGGQYDGLMPQVRSTSHSKEDREIWVSFHEGFSNAVRKPITLEELIKGF